VKRWGAAQGRIINPVLIISYESLRDLSKVLKDSPIGLLLCDEGHRLKNSCKYLYLFFYIYANIIISISIIQDFK
jgi:DNA repair and recombination RAD54-like protein